MPLEVGDVVTLEIIDIVYGGLGFARFNNQPVYIAYSLPGEIVNARVTRLKGIAAYASIVDLVRTAPQRVVPACKWFGTCGGCQWQHIDYDTQLEFKRDIIRRKLSELAAVDFDVPLPIPAADPWNYRAHITMHRAASGNFGFIGTDGRAIVNVDECLIAREKLATALLNQLPAELRDYEHVRAFAGNTDERIILSPVTLSSPVTTPSPINEAITFADVRVKDSVFRVSSRSFFQANIAQTAHLVDLVLEFSQASQRKGLIVDLYSGVGLFSVFLAGTADELVAIESSPFGAADAIHNLRQCTNVTVLEGTVEDRLQTMTGTANLMIVDPPRAGVSAIAMSEIIRLQPEQIVYVSCNPATFARDVMRLRKVGYSLTRLQPIDMFPQTFHVELVAHFVR